MAFVTDSNRLQPLWQPPPTACLTASGATSEAPSLLVHRWGGPPVPRAACLSLQLHVLVRHAVLPDAALDAHPQGPEGGHHQELDAQAQPRAVAAPVRGRDAVLRVDLERVCGQRHARGRGRQFCGGRRVAEAQVARGRPLVHVVAGGAVAGGRQEGLHERGGVQHQGFGDDVGQGGGKACERAEGGEEAGNRGAALGQGNRRGIDRGLARGTGMAG